MSINKELFKQKLWDKGIEMSDQEIEHFIALQNGADSLGPLVLENELSEDIYNVIENWEGGDRAERHNNPGAHRWTPEREAKYGAEKGDPFIGTTAEGNEQTFYTAKYATIAQGEAASRDVTSSIMRTVKNTTGLDYDDPEFSSAFASHYTGLDSGDSLDNYSESIQTAIETNTILPSRSSVAGGLTNLTLDSGGNQSSMFDSAVGGDPYATMFDIDYAQFKTPEERNAAVDFGGNLLWNFLDTSTFGALGALDYEDYLEDFLSGEEGPTTFSGRVGAGLGGLAGFIAPMMGVKGVAKAAVSAGKYGTKTFSKNVAKEGAEFLSKKAGVSNKGYKAFNKLTEKEKVGFFKSITDDVVSKSTKFAQQNVDGAFAKTLTKSSPKAINDALQAHGLPNTPANIEKISGIIEKALTANGGKSVIPISTLQQRIALFLGGTKGSNKIATIASHMLEEGLLFAAVETPMEVFQSMNEERDMDLFGRAKHAFALGTALGVIRMIPGGKTWMGVDGKNSSISKETFRGAMRKVSTNRPYKDLDLNNEESGSILLRMVESAWDNMGSGAPKFFNSSLKGFRSSSFKKKGVIYPDVLDDMNIVLKEQLRILKHSKEGRERLSKILDDLHGNWEKGWGPSFLTEVMEDLGGSSFRMLAGSAAFNYEVVFDDRIPLEDKIFHTLLGAWMTKQGRKVDFRNNAGALETLIPQPEYVGKKYLNTMNYLGELNMTPLDFTLNALAKGKKLETEYIQAAGDSPDVKKVLDLVKKYGLAVDPDMPNPVGVKNRARTGKEPVYDFLKTLIDGGYIPMEGMKLLDPYYINKKDLLKFIAELKGLKFDESKLKGINTPRDISDLVYEASDKAFSDLSKLHLEAAIGIHNHLVGKEGVDNVVLPEDGSLPSLPQILARDAKTLSYENDLLLQKYAKLLIMLENKELVVDRATSKKVNDADFNGLSENVDLYNAQINKLINGTDEIDKITSASLAQEGWTTNLLNRYHNKKGIRITHELLNDLDNSNWRDPGGGVQHDGKKVSKLQDEIFVDKQSTFLYSDIKFGKDVDPSLQQFITAYFHIMKTNPFSRTTFLDGGSRVLTIKNGNQKEAKAAVELRSTLQRNRIGGFSHQDAENTALFLKEYEMYSIDRHISGATKKDGKPLGDYDRAVLNELIRMGLIGRNFEMVDIKGIIDPLAVQGKATKANLLNISKLFKVNFKDKDLDKFLADNITLDTIFEMIAKRNGQSKALTLKELLESYNELIDPYIMDGKGNGVLRPASKTIAEVELTEIYSWITRLSSLKKIREHVDNKDLVSQFEKLSKDKDLDKQSREYIEYVFRNLDNKNFNHKELIAALSNKGLYDALENKLLIDPDNPKLTDQLREIFEDKSYDLVKTLDQTIINNTINDYKGLFEKDNDVDIYINASRESIRKDYNLGENYDFSKSDQKTLINDGYLEVDGKKYYFEGKKTNSEADHAMTASQRSKFLADITKMVFATGQERKLKRLYVTGSGVYTDFDFKMYDNSLFRTLDFLLTDVNNIKKVDTGFSIVDLSFTDNKMNKLDIRDKKNVSARKDLLKALDGEILIDKDLKTDLINQLNHEKSEGHILIGMGDLNYGIGIDKASLPTLGENLYKKLKEWKQNYSDSKYDEIHKTLMKVFNRTFERNEIPDGKGVGTGQFEYVFKQRNKNKEAQDLEILVTTTFLDGPNKKLGLQKYFWNHLVETHNKNQGMTVAKLARRIRLMANTSMKELSKDHLENTISLYEKFGVSKHGVRKSADSEMLKSLRRIRNNDGFKIVIAEDENFVSGEASILKELDKQVKKAQKNNTEVNLLGVQKNEATGELEFNNGSDISSLDSYTAVNPKIMKALYALVGANNVDGLGGVKPLIHRYGDAVILGKTAFISDPSFNKFFKDNDVDMIMMNTAAKAHYDPSRVLTGWGSVEELRQMKLGNKQKDLIETIGIDEISLGSIVNSDKSAALPQQTFKDLNITEGTKAYEWLMEKKVTDLNNLMVNLFDTKSLDAHSLAQYLNESRSTDNNNSLYQRLISHKFNPLSSLVRNDFLNNVKSHTIDKGGVITPRTEHGTQSVTSPGEGLRYTLFELIEDGGGIKNSLYTFGQIDIPQINANKKVVLRDLHIVENNLTSKDRIIKFSELSKEIKDINNKEFKGKPTFSDIYQAVSAYSNKFKTKNYEIAVTVRRNPNTRPGDVSIVGVRNILPKEYGNTVKLNAYDFAMRHEGDYDIDKIDVWWDTPNEILTKWRDLSGEVIRVNPDGEIKKTTLNTDTYGGSQLDWLKQGSMSKYRDDIYASEKMRGVIVKMQRSLQALEQYDNKITTLKHPDGSPIQGYILDLANKKGGIIYIDSKRLKEAKEILATDIQNITDATTGYDKSRYDMDTWEKKFLFGDGESTGPYNGIFKKAQWDGKKFVADDTPAELWKDDLYMDVITKSISPYKRLLQLGTNVFSEGKAQKVKYEDIISYVDQFDYDMSALNRKIYWSLRKNPAYRNRLSELNEIFLTPNGQKRAGDLKRLTIADFNSGVFGNWNNSIRPNIVSGGNSENFSRMLPFERAMVTVAAFDKSKISRPEQLFGEEAVNFDKFFEEHFHSKNYDEAAISFINKINENNGFVNYLNYLDYKIKTQSRARANAYRNGQTSLGNYLEKNVEKLETKKRELEEKLIFEGDPKDSKEFAYKMREGAKNSIVSEIVRTGKLPYDWKKRAGELAGPSDFSFDGVRSWAKTDDGGKALNAYVKKRPIRFKGIQSMEHLELHIWDNMLEPLKNLVIGEDANIGRHLREEMASEVRGFKKAYGKLWSDVFAGRDPLHDQSRANSEVMYMLEQKFLKWEEHGGYGRLFLFKLMAPEIDPNTYTYLKIGDTPKVLPSFKSESLSFIKLGLKFFNQTEHIDEYQKNNMFEYMTSWHNSSFRAFYGQRSNRSDFFNSYLSDLTNERLDVMRASPLLDDITPYKFGGGMQQQLINPEVSFAFGLHPNQSIGTMMSNEMLFPSAIKTMAESTLLAYTPKAYINAAVSGKAHPAIHGYKDYNNAVNGQASALLGDAFYQNLVYEKSVNHFKGAYHEIPSFEGDGRASAKAAVRSKTDCF